MPHSHVSVHNVVEVQVIQTLNDIAEVLQSHVLLDRHLQTMGVALVPNSSAVTVMVQPD